MNDIINKVHCAECVSFMKEKINNDSIDLTITSPPYDNMRSYNGYTFDFEAVAKELYRITKKGGVVVWVVGDQTVKGSETLTSFKQALFFKEIGFNVHDTMIWNKGCFTGVGSLKTRYAPVFEYMFILSRGKPKTFNPIKDKPNKWAGTKNHGRVTNTDGSTKPKSNNKIISEFGQRYNIWDLSPQRQKGENRHPAPFPEKLAHDHIISWSNPGDVVFDPMCGSGTTLKMAKSNGRNYLGVDISSEYVELSNTRLENVT